MFRAMISPIFRSTRLCYCLWYNAPTMLPATGRQHRGCIIPQAVTQSSAPEDGRNHRPKHVELIGIISKRLLLHLVGCLRILLHQRASLTVQQQMMMINNVHNRHTIENGKS